MSSAMDYDLIFWFSITCCISAAIIFVFIRKIKSVTIFKKFHVIIGVFLVACGLALISFLSEPIFNGAGISVWFLVSFWICLTGIVILELVVSAREFILLWALLVAFLTVTSITGTQSSRLNIAITAAFLFIQQFAIMYFIPRFKRSVVFAERFTRKSSIGTSYACVGSSALAGFTWTGFFDLLMLNGAAFAQLRTVIIVVFLLGMLVIAGILLTRKILVRRKAIREETAKPFIVDGTTILPIAAGFIIFLVLVIPVLDLSVINKFGGWYLLIMFAYPGMLGGGVNGVIIAYFGFPASKMPDKITSGEVQRRLILMISISSAVLSFIAIMAIILSPITGYVLVLVAAVDTSAFLGGVLLIRSKRYRKLRSTEIQ